VQIASAVSPIAIFVAGVSALPVLRWLDHKWFEFLCAFADFYEMFEDEDDDVD
jgi:hypothetical protein